MKSNPLTECIVARTFDTRAFEEQRNVRRPENRHVPFYFHYRPEDPHPTSCFGGLHLAQSHRDGQPGIYYDTENGWECCPTTPDGVHDAAMIFYCYRPHQKTVEVVLAGFSGRATASLANDLATCAKQIWPPQYQQPDLKIGDQVVLKIYGQDLAFKIVGSSLGSSYATMLYANYDYIARATDRVGEADALFVRTQSHDAESVNASSRALEAQLDRTGVGVDMLSTIISERDQAEAIFDVIVSLLLVMAFLLALVGGLGLMGTMSINVLERTREIGVLRAIGAPNRGVAQVFILEGLGIGLMSWVMGALLAIPMTRGLNTAVGGAIMGVPLSYSYSMPGLWIWLGTVIVLSVLASFIPARNASRLTVREVLAYE